MNAAQWLTPLLLRFVQKSIKCLRSTYKNLRGRHLQRREAILLLREICALPETPMLTCVYLKSQNSAIDSSSKDFELYIKANGDAAIRKTVEWVAFKHHLEVSEDSHGFLMVYSPRKRLLEITV
jgi:hypothetical protein